MGKRESRKKTRENKEMAIRAEIRTGLAGGEKFRAIARIVSGRYPVSVDEALRMTRQEYGQTVEKSSTGLTGLIG